MYKLLFILFIIKLYARINIFKKQLIFLMIANGEGWHYLAVTRPSTSLRGAASNSNGDFYCLSFLHLFRTKTKLESHKKSI